MPIFIKWNTQFKNEGEIRFNNPKLFSCRVGIGSLGFNRKNDICIIKNNGIIIINGFASIGAGSSICNNGKLVLGENFNISGCTRILCEKEIIFGKRCLISWDCQIMDSDFHQITKNNKVKDKSLPINIGDNVWITNSVHIYKGVTILDGCIISARSTLKRNVIYQNCVISSDGSEVKKISENIKWEF